MSCLKRPGHQVMGKGGERRANRDTRQGEHIGQQGEKGASDMSCTRKETHASVCVKSKKRRVQCAKERTVKESVISYNFE